MAQGIGGVFRTGGFGWHSRQWVNKKKNGVSRVVALAQAFKALHVPRTVIFCRELSV